MMIKQKLFWGLLMILLLCLGVWLLSNNQGYVLIVRTPYRIQFSFNFLLFLMVMAFLSLHYLLRLVRYLQLFPRHWRINQANKRLKESHHALIETVNALLNDDLATAEQAAKRAQSLHENSSFQLTIESLVRKKSNS